MNAHRLTALAAACLLLVCCGGQPPPPLPGPTSTAARTALGRLVEAYWDDTASRRSVLAPIDVPSLAAARALEQHYLEALRVLPRPADPEEALTYDLFRREREQALAGFTFPQELLPINPFDAAPVRFALRAAASDALSSSQAASWEAQARDFARWSDQAIANLQEGERRGYLLPRVLVEESLPALAQLAADVPDNPFNAGLRSPTPGLSSAVRGTLLPAYRRLHDFLQNDYQARARDSVALRELPLGDSWYAWLIRSYTGRERNPAELHALGRADLERIQARVQALLAQTAYSGNLAGYLRALEASPSGAGAMSGGGTASPLSPPPPPLAPRAEGDSLDAVRARLDQASAASAALFERRPRSLPILRPVPPFRGPTGEWLQYEPASASAPDAVLWLDARAVDSVESLGGGMSRILAESVPGRHLESVNRTLNAALPRFRRFGGDRAFEAGWALYAAGLGEELGLYRDTAAHLEPLLQEERCALGMVVDTGLQTQGWTRAQALTYVQEHLPLDADAARRLVDRAIALPGEALACGVGLSEIRALRSEAEQRLGTRFVASQFHAALLSEGALPPDLLALRMRRWLDTVH